MSLFSLDSNTFAPSESNDTCDCNTDTYKIEVRDRHLEVVAREDDDEHPSEAIQNGMCHHGRPSQHQKAHRIVRCVSKGVAQKQKEKLEAATDIG